jgi:hypothetical protein
MSQKKIRKPRVRSTRVSTELGEQQIAVRAYERWMERGCPISDGLEDWLAARQELEIELSSRRETA